MDKNKDVILKILSIICIVVGAYFLLNSTEMGSIQTNKFVKTMGGSVDTNYFLAHFHADTETYRTFGGVLLAIGLIRLLQK